MKINGIPLTPARKSTLIQISRGRKICNKHARALGEMGLLSIKRGVATVTPAGWEVIEAFGQLE